MMRTSRNYAGFLAVMFMVAVAGCKTRGDLDHQIDAANKGVTVVLTSTSGALNAKLISVKQAESVSAIAHQVNPLLDSAKAASDANDTTNADKTMRLVTALLAGLEAYVPPAK